MNRKRRTKIFIEYAQDEVKKMAEEIKDNLAFEYIQRPKERLVMIKARESAKNSLFYLGELLVTETKVRIKDRVGIGIVKGHDEELSEALAIADAAYKLKLDIVEDYEKVFEEREGEGLKKLQKQRNIIARTKVDFEMMNN
ncbi:MAG: phosphonate C-P lyase system protein PhnG [Finegoldia sp.]|nr:phosphonate C-P lyase system protein PhnG [Finegoldia sp.]